MVPPTWARRSLLTPLLFVLTVVVIVVFPVVWPVARLASLVGGERNRAVRLLWFALAWGLRESAAVLALGWLWCRRRARSERNYAVIRWYVAGLHRAAARHLGLRIIEDGTWDGDPAGDRPLIVLSRHAGPGDALLLVHHLLSGYRRTPRVVMKAALQLDPCIDIAAHRVPNVFVSPGGSTDAIGRLATGLGRRDAVVIFPEGGNFSPERRHRAIRRLARLRRWGEAAEASRMANVMPPRPGGVVAAITAAPTADVVFVAHVGLDHMATARDVWGRVPLTRPVHVKWWRIAAADVPRDRDVQVHWLYEQWRRADAWITAQKTLEAGH